MSSDVKRLSGLDKKVFPLALQNEESKAIATKLGVEVEDVEEALDRLEEAGWL